MSAATATKRVSWWTTVFDVPASVRSLAILRILLGPAVIWHLRPFLSDARSGVTYRDQFWQPFFTWYPEAPEGIYVALLWAGVVTAVMMTVGLFTRFATAATLFVVAYNLFLSETHFHHNRAYLVALLLGVTLANSGRVLSVDALLRSPADDRDTVWPLWLLRFEAAAIYVASGSSKLVDPDWIGGTVLHGRVIRYEAEARASGAPDIVMDVVTTRAFHSVLSPLAVATELFIGLAIWHRRTRLAAIWAAIWFHVAIEISAEVQVFTYIAISALVIWAVPSTRDRLLVTPYPDLRWLDWLARFDIRAGESWRVLDRDGTAYEGSEARWFAMSRLPATFLVGAVVRRFR